MFKSKFIFLAVMAGLFFYAQFAPAEELKPLYSYNFLDRNDPRYMLLRGGSGLAEDRDIVESINPDNVVSRLGFDIAVRQPDGSIEIVNVEKNGKQKALMLTAVALAPILITLDLVGAFDDPVREQKREQERQRRIALGDAIRSSPPLSRPAYELRYTFPDTDSYLGSDGWGPGQEFISGADGMSDPINGGTINSNSSMGVITAGVQAGQKSLAQREVQKYGYTTGHTRRPQEITFCLVSPACTSFSGYAHFVCPVARYGQAGCKSNLDRASSQHPRMGRRARSPATCCGLIMNT